MKNVASNIRWIFFSSRWKIWPFVYHQCGEKRPQNTAFCLRSCLLNVESVMLRCKHLIFHSFLIVMLLVHHMFDSNSIFINYTFFVCFFCKKPAYKKRGWIFGTTVHMFIHLYVSPSVHLSVYNYVWSCIRQVIMTAADKTSTIHYSTISFNYDLSVFFKIEGNLG